VKGGRFISGISVVSDGCTTPLESFLNGSYTRGMHYVHRRGCIAVLARAVSNLIYSKLLIQHVKALQCHAPSCAS
jgi:hypothetical protein